MRRYFTSDLHFFHKRICNLTNRLTPEATVDEHTNWLHNLWNSQVKPEDIVFHLGDFAFTNKGKKVEDLCRSLNGSKIFLRGNHDDDKVVEWFSYFLGGSDSVLPDFYDYKEIEIDGHKTVLFHYPIEAWNRQHHDSFHLHGHCHGNLTNKQGKRLDVGLDNAYNVLGEHRFFTEEDILAYMKKTRVLPSGPPRG